MKRNYIRFITNPVEVAEGKEPNYKTFVSPAFVPYRKVYEALDIMEKMENSNDEERVSEREATDIMINFIVDLYSDQFTAEEMMDGLNAPDAFDEIKEQVAFFAQGFQSEERKKELKALLK